MGQRPGTLNRRPLVSERNSIRLFQWCIDKRFEMASRGNSFDDMLDELLKEVGY